MIEKDKLAKAKNHADKLDKLVKQVEGAETILAGFTSKEKYPVLEMRINGVSLKDDMRLTPREQYEFFGMAIKGLIATLQADAAEAYNKA